MAYRGGKQIVGELECFKAKCLAMLAVDPGKCGAGRFAVVGRDKKHCWMLVLVVQDGSLFSNAMGWGEGLCFVDGCTQSRLELGTSRDEKGCRATQSGGVDATQHKYVDICEKNGAGAT